MMDDGPTMATIWIGDDSYMAHQYINRQLYDAIVRFDVDEAAQDYYYQTMDALVERKGRQETVRSQILRAYAMLFCDDLDMAPGQMAGPDEVEATADRLYTGSMGFDPQHWYRMRYHFPRIDEDNYDRFAALVVSDLSAGPLHDAALEGGDMLLLGEKDPLHMTSEQRAHQQLQVIKLGGGSEQ